RLDGERRAAAAAALDVGIAQIESRGHQLFGVVELGAVQIEEALAVNHQLGTVALENLVAGAFFVEIHPVLESGATAADDLDAQSFRRIAIDEAVDLADRVI